MLSTRINRAGVLSCLLLTAAVVRADLPRPLGDGPVAPTTAQTDATRVSTPYWTGGQSGQSDLPAADIRRAGRSGAGHRGAWAFNQSLDDLSFALRVNQMQFNLRPDVVAAMSDEHVAYAAMENERPRALAPLNDNAAYLSSMKLGDNVTEQIADERDSDAPDRNRLLGMAAVRLNYVQDNRKLETSLLQRDDGYQKARQRFLDAVVKVSDLRKADELEVMTRSDLATLRHDVAVARITKLATAAYRNSVTEARDIALDYASYYRGVDRYHPNYLDGGYGGYSFGNGYRY